MTVSRALIIESGHKKTGKYCELPGVKEIALVWRRNLWNRQESEPLVDCVYHFVRRGIYAKSVKRLIIISNDSAHD